MGDQDLFRPNDITNSYYLRKFLEATEGDDNGKNAPKKILVTQGKGYELSEIMIGKIQFSERRQMGITKNRSAAELHASLGVSRYTAGKMNTSERSLNRIFNMGGKSTRRQRGRPYPAMDQDVLDVALDEEPAPNQQHASANTNAGENVRLEQGPPAPAEAQQNPAEAQQHPDDSPAKKSKLIEVAPKKITDRLYTLSASFDLRMTHETLQDLKALGVDTIAFRDMSDKVFWTALIALEARMKVIIPHGSSNPDAHVANALLEMQYDAVLLFDTQGDHAATEKFARELQPKMQAQAKHVPIVGDAVLSDSQRILDFMALKISQNYGDKTQAPNMVISKVQTIVDNAKRVREEWVKMKHANGQGANGAGPGKKNTVCRRNGECKQVDGDAMLIKHPESDGKEKEAGEKAQADEPKKATENDAAEKPQRQPQQQPRPGYNKKVAVIEHLGGCILGLASNAIYYEAQKNKPKEESKQLARRGFWGDVWRGISKGNLWEVPGLLKSAAAKPLSEENRVAFFRSAGDLWQAIKDIPSSVKSSLGNVATAENLEAFAKSAVDFIHGVRDIPHAAASGAKDVVSVENYDAFAKSLVDFAKAVREIPGAIADGVDDLRQAPGDIAVAFQKLPGQLAKASGEFMGQYDKYIPVGSDGRKILDSIFLSMPVRNIHLPFSGQRIGDAVENACPALLSAFIEYKEAENAGQAERGRQQKREVSGELEAFRKSSSLGRRLQLTPA
ncbi:hypothetical protein DCS_04242 [Drechmeria coniospora]|uniref:Uncharacterized protein n=1 Tax=Drechmeria coniospora TaxID=98403 RepID=A0A151GJE4_DRECN|nr:hypothetical protein DCS_04242 [Drechmeria coniospora]KYK57235.1 hypothetical protein DCS_04242 [Drechmeria coniospora]